MYLLILGHFFISVSIPIRANYMDGNITRNCTKIVIYPVC